MRITEMIIKDDMSWFWCKFSQLVLKEIYEEQWGENACWYWSLKGQILTFQTIFPSTVCRLLWPLSLKLFAARHFLAKAQLRFRKTCSSLTCSLNISRLSVTFSLVRTSRLRHGLLHYFVFRVFPVKIVCQFLKSRSQVQTRLHKP